MAIELAPIGESFVAEMRGVDLAQPLGVEARQAIVDGMARFGVLVFRGQSLTNDAQMAFGQNFGVLERGVHAYGKGESLHARPEIADVSNLDDNGRVRGINDRQRMFSLGNQLWHTDSSFRRTPGAFSILHAHGAPPAEGGETEFADLRAAYDALPDALRRQVEGVFAEHSLMHSRATLGFADFTAEEKAALPPVLHPVVRFHAPSGRKSLYLASHASHVVGMPVPDGRMLLRDLIEFATDRRFVHRHVWREGDVVMWDNRCTMHRGRPYDQSQPRDMRRVTTSDDQSGELAAVA